MKLKFDKTKGEWIQLEDNSSDPDSIYLDGFLKAKLDNVKAILKKNWDCVIIIDGPERSGKSTLGMTIAHYISDETFVIENMSSGGPDIKRKISECKEGSVLIDDESSMNLNSKDAMKKENVELQKILDVVGQKNLTLILILPSFFDLMKNISVRRARFLLHVYTDENLNRGYFAYYGTEKKRYLYELGKKNFGSYSKPEPEFTGRFTKFQPQYYAEYLKLKKKSLMEALNIDKAKDKPVDKEVMKQIILKFKENNPEVSVKDIAKGFGIAERTFFRYHNDIIGGDECHTA